MTFYVCTKLITKNTIRASMTEISEAAKVFYRIIALKYILEHSKVQKRLERILDSLFDHGLDFCGKCELVCRQMDMTLSNDRCLCQPGIGHLQVCGFCNIPPQPCACGTYCGTIVCPRHKVLLGCQIEPDCIALQSHNCVAKKTCTMCNNIMCFKHNSSEHVDMCITCYSEYIAYYNKQHRLLDKRMYKFTEKMKTKKRAKSARLGSE